MATRLEQLEAKRQRLALEIRTGMLELQNRRLKDVLKKRHFEGADRGERFSKWRVPSGSGPNSVLRPALRTLRERSRDTIRNNPYGESISAVLVNSIVGTGIMPSIKNNRRLAKLWEDWAESTQCDATGISNLRGLQTLMVQEWVENGEVLFRRVLRPDWKPGEIPFAIQILEPDYIDDALSGLGGDYRMGVKLNEYGAPTAYRIFSRHPYENDMFALKNGANTSMDIPVSEIGNLFWRKRAGQIRGIPLMAPAIIRMRGLDEFDDAELTRRKLAACFMAFVKNLEGEDEPEDDLVEMLTPGLIQQLRPGEEVQFATPPAAGGYGDYKTDGYRAIAAGVGITYEDLTGDYSKVNFASGRLGRMKFYGNLDSWQWQMVIPQFCAKVFGWFKDGAEMLSVPCKNARAEWTAPRRPVTDSSVFKDLRDEVRAGFKSMPEAIRENGYDPEQIIAENKDFYDKLDAAKLIIDCDPRKVSSAGQIQPVQPNASAPPSNGGAEVPVVPA